MYVRQKITMAFLLLVVMMFPARAQACEALDLGCHVNTIIQVAYKFANDRLKEAVDETNKVISQANSVAQGLLKKAHEDANNLRAAVRNEMLKLLPDRIANALKLFNNITQQAVADANVMVNARNTAGKYLPGQLLSYMTETDPKKIDWSFVFSMYIPSKDGIDAGVWGQVFVPSEEHKNNTSVPRVGSCDAGAMPETGIQGQVPYADRVTGRSQQGYRCNMSLVSQYQGVGTDVVSQSNDRCAYMPSVNAGQLLSGNWTGVQVVDFADKSNPRSSTQLKTNAFKMGTWESLRISPDGTKLAGGGVTGVGLGLGNFDIYDISKDCSKPELLNKTLAGQMLDNTGPIKPLIEGVLPRWVKDSVNNSQPILNIAHEGEWSPDSKTYWLSGLASGTLTAIDVSNPKLPKVLYFGLPDSTKSIINHGLSFSPDGRRLYMTTTGVSGIRIFDVTSIQDRYPQSQRHLRLVGSLAWGDGGLGQKVNYVTYGNKPYLISTDEAFASGIRFIDISDETKPKIVSQARLEVQLPKNLAAITKDLKSNGQFGYDVHYCTPDRQTDPTALACGYWQSGIRVFNIADPKKLKEVAYYNPPARPLSREMLTGSAHVSMGNAIQAPIVSGIDASQLKPIDFSPHTLDMTTDYCSSIPRWSFSGGDAQIWMACTDNGMQILKLSKNVYPIK